MLLTSPHISLAVYREIAAHLRQIEGISVIFLAPSDRVFNYTESQLGGLEIFGVDLLREGDRHRLDRILAYYENQS